MRTVGYWQRWVKHCHLPEEWQSEVVRSALVLKLHQFEDTGGIVAATTTSIPEAPASSRNWDYRYCWLRDAYFTVHALRRLSHFEELEGFERFLRDVIRRSDGNLQPVYSVSGDAEIEEREIRELAGYQGHKPVRVGNDAFRQIQHDIYGQALMALQPLFTDVRFTNETDLHSPDIVVMLLDAVEASFDSPDAGLWEVRGAMRIHTFTKLMHWAGCRAAAKIALHNGMSKFHERASRLEASARLWIEERAWSEPLGSLEISPGAADVDAALLLAINLGFFEASDPRAARMVEAMQKRLASERGLLRRYSFDDGLGPGTTCFTVCSFWLAEALARIGKVDAARRVFEAVLANANHLGLLSEDIDSASGQLWGNFPQTYSHVGLINAAFAISAEAERQQLSRSS
jgi:GH15 family glucan-1,4-alpha-glucosidase